MESSSSEGEADGEYNGADFIAISTIFATRGNLFFHQMAQFDAVYMLAGRQNTPVSSFHPLYPTSHAAGLRDPAKLYRQLV